MSAGLQWNQPREKWDAWDPMLLSEGLFSAANIFSSLKLVYIFSVNPHLGPLQVSLSRMVLDILKFFVLDILVIFAFSCGECSKQVVTNKGYSTCQALEGGGGFSNNPLPLKRVSDSY